MLLVIAAAMGFGGEDLGSWFDWVAFISWIPCAVVTAAQGKWLLLACDLFVWFFSYVAVFRLAKPWSWWARTRYDEATMHRAHLRYGEHPTDAPFAKST